MHNSRSSKGVSGTEASASISQAFLAGRPDGLRSRRRGVARRAAVLQSLESRRLLAAVSWDGGAGTFAWTDPDNWSNNQLPTAADDVTIDIPAAITVTLASGAQSVNSLTSAEGLTISAGSLSVAAASSVAGAFSLSGSGSVGGAGDLTLQGASSWTGGSMTGTGTTIIGAAGTLALSSGTNVVLQRSLTNNGIVNWSGTGDVRMTDSTITNNGTINHQNSGTADYGNFGGTNQVINAGTINKPGNGTVRVFVPLTNNGTLDSTSGTLQIAGGLTNNGAISGSASTINFNSAATYGPSSTVNGAASASFIFSAGTHTLDPARYTASSTTAVQGTATVTLNTVPVTLSSTITGTLVANVPLTINNAAINATATFNQPVTLTGAPVLGGNVVFNSTTTTTFASLQITAGTTKFTQPTAMSVDTLTLGGTLDTPANLTINTAGTIGGGGLLGGGLVTIPAAVTVNVSASGFNDTVLAKNITNSGTFNMSGGGNLNFAGVTFTNDGTLNLTGSGADFVVASGTNALINNGTITRSGTTASIIRVPTTNNDAINITGGTLTFDSALTALTNNGTAAVSTGATLNVTTVVTNPGSVISGAGTVGFLAGGTSTLNPATFNTTGDLLFVGGTVTLNIPRTLPGNRVMAGVVTFNQPVTIAGTLTVNGGATTTFASSATITGDVSVSGRLNVDTPSPGVTIGNLSLSGVQGGSGLLVVTGNIANASANMQMDGAGTTRLAPGGTITNVNNTWNIGGGRTFQNQGTVTMGSNSPDIFMNGATFLNEGVFQSVNGTADDRIFDNGGTNLFINNGTILKNVGAANAALSINVPIQHNGLINVGPGILVFNGTGSVYNPGSITTGTGEIRFNAGTHTFQSPNTLTGLGTAGGFPVFNGGTATFNVDTTILNGRFGGSTIEGPGNLSLGNGTDVFGGTFSATGGGRLNVPAGQTAELTGNNPVFARPFDILGTFQMSSGGDLNVFNSVVTVEIGGTLHFNTGAGGSDVEYGPGATSGTLLNKGTVLRDSTGTASIGVRFDNRGLVDINGGTLAINGGFADGTYTRTTGIYDVQTGSLGLSTINTNGAEMIFRTGSSVSGLVNLQFNDGKLDLRDGVDLFFDPFAAQANTMYNRGQIELSPGSVMTVAAGNNLVFAGTGNATVRSEIAGPTDAEYGRLVVGGQLRLTSPDGGDSQFDPDLIGGYDPATGTRFNIVTANSIVDSFDDFFGATTPSGNILLAGKSATQYYAEVGTGTPPAPPQILSSAFQFETREAIVLTFNIDISAFVSRRDLVLTNLTTNTVINPDIGALTYDANTNTATYTLTNLLPTGNYRLSITADDIANAAGVPLTNPLTLDFHILPGDADRDRDVDFNDLVTLARNYNQTGRTYSQGNFDYSSDGLVGFSDLVILARNYGGNLSADFARAMGTVASAGGSTRTMGLPERSVLTTRGEVAAGSRSAFAAGSVIGAGRTIGSVGFGLDRRDESVVA